MQKRATAILVATISIFAQSAYADELCNSILKYGIFDKQNIVSIDQQEEMLSNSICSGNGVKGGGSYAGYGLSYEQAKSYCSANASERKSSSEHLSVISTASSVIADAWSKCIEDLSTGFYHRITTTPDPAIFYYEIGYRSDGAPFTRQLQTFVSPGATCQSPLHADISNIKSFLCRRNPSRPVSIAVNASCCTSHLARISLLGQDTHPTTPLMYGQMAWYATTPADMQLNWKQCDQRNEFVCSLNPAAPTRIAYDFSASQQVINKQNDVLIGALPKGKYRLDIEYASPIAIPEVAIHAGAAGDQPSSLDPTLDFPSTGGSGFNHRGYVSVDIDLSASGKLILDRGGQFPEIRAFIFHPR